MALLQLQEEGGGEENSQQQQHRGLAVATTTTGTTTAAADKNHVTCHIQQQQQQLQQQQQQQQYGFFTQRLLRSKTPPPPGPVVIHHERLLPHAPVHYGLLLSLDPTGSTCRMKFVPDANLRQLHPNIYAPASLRNVKRLGGGGSGVTVFSGRYNNYNKDDNDDDDKGGKRNKHHDNDDSDDDDDDDDDTTKLSTGFNNVVMKHGGEKDTGELFALATIGRQLHHRGRSLGETKWELAQASDAMVDMQGRLPQLAFVYISPQHLKERSVELWAALRLFVMNLQQSFHHYNSSMHNGNGNCNHNNSRSNSSTNIHRSFMANSSSSNVMDDSNHSQRTATELGKGRHIRIFQPKEDETDDDDEFATTTTTSSEAVVASSKMPKTSIKVHGEHFDIILGRECFDSGKNSPTTPTAGTLLQSNNNKNNNKADKNKNAKDHQQPRQQQRQQQQQGNGNEYSSSSSLLEFGNTSPQGYRCLKAIVTELRRLQREKFWKVTLAQTTIGGRNPQTAASLLAAGQLRGPMLQHLIREEIKVIRNLQHLTLEEEKPAIDIVKREVEELLLLQEVSSRSGSSSCSSSSDNDSDSSSSPPSPTATTTTTTTTSTCTAADVSDLADAFVGMAIKKNFHPTEGRFHKLHILGARHRAGKLILTKEEQVPVDHLAALCEDISRMTDVFTQESLLLNSTNGLASSSLASSSSSSSSSSCCGTRRMMDLMQHQWRDLLQDAVSIKCRAGVERIWTCGLNDGGLHNLFLSPEKLYLFDLGEPNLQPLPAFLTKFLMSFFHTLGMEEEEREVNVYDHENDNIMTTTTVTTWVNRFQVSNNNENETEKEKKDDGRSRGKLTLTPQTAKLLPIVYEAFGTTMDHFIRELFDGEEAVRSLLIKYVCLQLLSDAGFCLERWQVKGGGRERVASNNHHQTGLEKWLWRALWDIYICQDVCGKVW